MKSSSRPPIWVVIINILLSALTASAGAYALIEKKMIISGKYSGNLYLLKDSESIVIAISFFMVSAFFILFLFDNKKIKTLAEWLLGLGVVLFLFSSFI